MPLRFIKKTINKKKAAVTKLVIPKVVTAFANILRLGPRIIIRSTIELMRANLITRILSCLTLLAIDLVDLVRKRISKVQFVTNVILSALLVVSGTVGWNLGSRWIIIEFFGGIVDIVGGIIGAGILSFASNLILDRVTGKFVETDAQKMWKMLDPYIDALPESEQEYVRDHVTVACLKGMYASNDKDAYAAELINKLQMKMKVKGVLRAERHVEKHL